MNTPAPEPPPLPSTTPALQSFATPTHSDPSATPWTPPGRVRRLLYFFGRTLLGMVLTQFVLGSLLILGWASRAMRREAHKAWALRSNFKDWAKALNSTPALQPWKQWPTWFAQPAGISSLVGGNPPGQPASRMRSVLRLCLGGAWMNLKLGFQMLFNSAVLVLPAMAMMQFAWYDGWNNS